MIYDFDHFPDRRDSDSLKWRQYGEDVLPLWVADMDFPSPEPVIRALRQRIEHGVFGYPAGLEAEPLGLMGLRNVIVERLAEHYAWQVQPDDLVFIPGVVTAFHLACHAIASPGGATMIQTPVYPPILSAARHTGCSSQQMELSPGRDGAYAVDLDAFEAAFTEQTRLFILCNPHNPVGRVFRADELAGMAQTCLRRGVVICSDEIHSDLVYEGYRHTPVATLDPEIAQQTITLMAPSKTYNLAGLQCSFAIIQNPELRRRYANAKKGLVPWVNLMGLVAAEAAYRSGQDWLDQLLAYLQANRDFLHQYVKHELPGVSMANPEGTYLAWLDCRQAGMDCNPFQFFLEQAKVALNDGQTFGRGGQGFVRLNFGCSRAVLQEALERMKAALTAIGYP